MTSWTFPGFGFRPNRDKVYLRDERSIHTEYRYAAGASLLLWSTASGSQGGTSTDLSPSFTPPLPTPCVIHYSCHLYCFRICSLPLNHFGVRLNMDDSSVHQRSSKLKSRRSIAHPPSARAAALKDNATTDIAALQAEHGSQQLTKKKSRGKSLGPGGIEALKETSANAAKVNIPFC